MNAAGAPAFPGATNTGLPGGGEPEPEPKEPPFAKKKKPDDDEEEPDQMSKEHEERLQRYEKELVDLRQDKRLSDQRLERLETENATAKRENTLTRYEMELVAKAQEGYAFDVKEELAIVADPMETGKPDSTPMSREQFDRHLKRLEKYERDPSKYHLLDVKKGKPGEEPELNEKMLDAAHDYMIKHKCSIVDAEKAIMGGAKA